LDNLKTELKNPLPETTFEGLSGPLREAAQRENWTTLMPVQARAIPYVMAGRDMMIQARTGSGKRTARPQTRRMPGADPGAYP
jgi:ATP-dependent RNA helicase DeaD